MSDTPLGRSLLAKGSIYTGATALQLLGAVLALPLLTRALDTTEFGRVAAAQVIVQFVALLAVIGLPGAITREYFDHDGPRRARNLVAVACASTLAVAGVAHLSGPWWARAFGSIGYDDALRLGVAAAAARAVQLATLAWFRARGAAVTFAAVAAGGAIGGQLAGLAAVWWRPTATAYLGGFAIANGIVAVTAVAATRPRIDLVGRGLVGPTLRYALPLLPHSLAGVVLMTGDRVLVDRFEGIEGVGRYQVASTLGALVITVLAAVNQAWSPQILALPEHRQRGALATTTAIVVSGAAAAAAGLALASPLGLAVLAPAGYDPEALTPVVALVAAAAIPYAWYLAGTHLVVAYRRTALLAAVTLLGAGVNVGLNLVLLPRWGLVGAAAATLGAFCLWAVALLAVVARVAPVQWEWRLPTRAAAAAAPLIAAGAVLPASGLGLAGRAVLAGGGVVAFGAIWRRRAGAASMVDATPSLTVPAAAAVVGGRPGPASPPTS